MLHTQPSSTASAGSSSRKQTPQIFVVGLVSFPHIPAPRHRPFNLHPAGVANLLDRVPNTFEINLAPAEQEAVLFHVEFANVLFSQPADFLGDVVATVGRIADVVVHFHRRGPDRSMMRIVSSALSQDSRPRTAPAFS